ncbi:uncharacterized protein [Antedon mediterranea]|uniref:uncharacterized protein n=1 Tax=Antedon mediterranea TaxID=105859 RepID=UPI003AF74D87
MIIMMYILRKRKSWQELDFIRNPQRQSLPSDERQPLLLEDFPPPEKIKYENVSEPLVGVYVFGTLNIILSVTHIVLTGMCVHLLTRDIDTYRQGVFIMYTFFQVFFTSVQMTFFRCFKGASFKNCSFFQYAFIFTMSSNILSLIDSVGNESLAVSGIPAEYKELDWPLIDLEPANMSNKNDNILICYDQIQTPLRTLFSSLQPFSKEFHIVCVSILLHYWMSMHPNNDRNTATRTRMVGSAYGTTTTNYNDNSRDQVRRRCITRTISDYRVNERTASNNKKTNYNCCQWIALAVFILLPSVFIIGMTELYTFIQYDIFGTIQIFTLLIYKSTMIIAIVFAKNYLNKTPQQLLCKSLNRSESLLLFCLIGVYVLSCCGGVSATGKLIADIQNLTETAEINKSQMNLSIARQLFMILLTIINIVQTSLQTILILKIRRTKSIDNDAKVIIRRCLKYLMITNATIWLSNIVVSPDSKTCFYDTNYFMFGDTMVIVNITFRSLAAYYRFTSVDLLYQASKSLKN